MSIGSMPSSSLPDNNVVATQCLASLASTQVYTHVDPEMNAKRVRERLNKFFLQVGIKPGPDEPESDEAGPEGFEPPAYVLRVYPVF